jgi:hypothetical protein
MMQNENMEVEEMRFKIHYTAYGDKDFVILSGDTPEDVREKWNDFALGRKIDEGSEWSEEV